MRIGIDIDGVILDFERTLKTYAELYNYLYLKDGGVKHPEEQYLRDRYEWNDEVRMDFANKYFVKLTKMSSLIPGAKDVIEMLKRDGHELIIISARGGTIKEMRAAAEEIFEREGLSFDETYWQREDKLETAKEAKIDIMIDDTDKVCRHLSSNQIRCLYFRDKNMKKLEENEYLTEVANWGEVYRIITETSK